MQFRAEICELTGRAKSIELVAHSFSDERLLTALASVASKGAGVIVAQAIGEAGMCWRAGADTPPPSPQTPPSPQDAPF